ncbi:MAG: phosphohistidine phosphatase, partial [Verrucomicrobia bacterium]
MKFLALLLLVFASATSVISAQPVVVIVRHAEKLAAGGNDPDLSPVGRTRAENLARILKQAKITAIFTSEFKRA